MEPVPHSSGTAAPRMAVPGGACDCHIHIVEPRFLAAGSDTSRFAGMAAADYRALQRRLGLERVVVVQPKGYGTRNEGTLAAIEALGPGARGVGVVTPGVDDATLRAMDAGGIRGVRFSVWQASDAVTTVEMIEPLAPRLAALGWHAQINMSADQVVRHATLLRRLPCALVFDHLGRLPGGAGPRHPAFAVLCDLLRTRRDVWMKLSGAYLDTLTGAPDYADVSEAARAYAALRPDRMVWGSDWPHVTEQHKPDDARLLDLLAEWVPDEAARIRVLRDNPAMLYGFH